MQLRARTLIFAMRKIIIVSILFTLAFHNNLSAQDSSVIKTKAPSSPKKIVVKYGIASFYHSKFNGRKTAAGTIFSSAKLTGACNVLPLGTWVKVTNVRNNKSVVVEITDRLHPKNKRLVDLSKAAAQKLGYVSAGLAKVRVEVLGKLKRA